MEKSALFKLFLASCLISLITAAPQTKLTTETDNNLDVLPQLMNQNVDYNAMLGHFKDFFLYLPVMFTTFRETMSGFPKIAEGIRILTSPNFDQNYEDRDDCKCKTKSRSNSNEIDKSDDLYR